MLPLLELDALPVWNGPADRPGGSAVRPFALGWDPAGFVRQTTDPAIVAEVIGGYAADGYTHATKPPGLSAWATRLGEDRIALVSGHFPALAGKRFLEVGGGTTYVGERLIRDFGVAQYVVVDPALKAGPGLPENLRVVADYFGPDMAETWNVDGVFGFHVFEHLPDPIAFLEVARRAVAGSNGQIAIAFPDCEGDMANGTPGAYIHEHISYFTDATARALFARAALVVRHFENRGGVLAYVLAPQGNALPAAAVAPSPEAATLGKRFRQFIEAARTRFEAVIAGGGKIHIHGATNATNTMMYLLGQRIASNAVVFDGDDSKAGRFLPWVSEPIRRASDPSYADAGEIFVAVPGYFDEIRAAAVQRHGLKIDRVHRLEQIAAF